MWGPMLCLNKVTNLTRMQLPFSWTYPLQLSLCTSSPKANIAYLKRVPKPWKLIYLDSFKHIWGFLESKFSQVSILLFGPNSCALNATTFIFEYGASDLLVSQSAHPISLVGWFRDTVNDPILVISSQVCWEKRFLMN